MLGRQEHLRALLRALHDRLEGGQQREEVDFEFGLVLVARRGGDAGVGADELGAADRLALVEQFRRGLEFLVLEQPPDQRFARILFGFAVGRRRFRSRQNRARLDVDQRRRHHQELAGDVQIQLLHQLDVGEVLLGNQRDRDVVDVHLVLLDEVNQQIERPLERFELDLVGVW